MSVTTGWQDTANKFAWYSPFTAPVPVAIREPLLRLQNARLYDVLPRLCLCIAASAVAMAMAVFGDLPWWQQFGPPAIIVGFCLFVWIRSRMRPLSDDPNAIAERLHNAMLASIGLGVLSGLWCVNAFNETERYYCMVAPVFIGIAGLVSATCLINVPRAAIAAMIMSVAPIAIKMLSYPNLGVRSMAVMMILITLLQSDVVLSKFRETVAMLSAQRELDMLAKSDPLTGLDNRRAFTKALGELIEEGGIPLVAIADLDGFKTANDSYGHHAGDVILKEVARRMQQVCLSAGSIARLGGDEFAVMFDISTGEEQAHREIEAIRHIVSMPFSYEGKTISIGTSIGTAMGKSGGCEVTDLLKRADIRLYADKTRRKSKALLLATA
jgi:diguanylate cyclase (GGDEF)-like protein